MVDEKDYSEVNHEVMGGLANAIEHGTPLKEAMMSFYRSGYSKEEIERAAKVYVDMQKDPAASLMNLKNMSKDTKEIKKVLSKSLKDNEQKENPEKKGFFSFLKKKKKEEEEKKVTSSSPVEHKEIKNENSQNNLNQNSASNQNPNPNEVQNKNLGSEEKPKIEEKKEGDQNKQTKVKQIVSNYDMPKKKTPKGKMITFILVLTLILLIGVLSLVVLFKSELVDFINGLFG